LGERSNDMVKRPRRFVSVPGSWRIRAILYP
jgi:hypothetical protein